MYFDKILSDHACEICASESGIALTGTVIGGDEKVVGFTFDIKDSDGRILHQPCLGCTWEKEASVSIGTKIHNEVSEQIALNVTPVQI